MSAWQWIVLQSQREDVYGNTLQRWLIAVVVLMIVALALRLIKRTLAGRLDRLAERTRLAWPGFMRGLVDRTRSWFLLAVSIYCASLALLLPEGAVHIVRSIVIVALLLQAALWGNALLNFAVIHYSKQRLATDAASATTISVLGFMAKLAMWALVLLGIYWLVGPHLGWSPLF